MIARTRAYLAAMDRVTWIVLAITAIALLTRTWDLGARAFHHDESQHAAFSYYFASGNGYRHDPLLHGPMQFHLIAFAFKLFGDSDFVARLPHALIGTALVATPLLVRRWLGGLGTITAALLITISPSILYFSRFAREDVIVALPTVLAFLAVWRYREEPRLRWLVLLSASLALSFTTKESAYLTAAVLLLYLDIAVAHRLFWSRPSSKGASIDAQLVAGLWLLPTAWIFAALWGPLARTRSRLGLEERPPEADLLLVTGTLVAPELAAFARGPLHALLTNPDQQLVGATAVIAIILVLAASVGREWRWDWWITCAAVFYGIALPLFATMGTNLPGVAGLFWNSLDYWLGQQGVKRGNGDVPLYYFMMVPLYEHLVLIPGLIGGWWLTVHRRDPFAALLSWWFLGTFAALSFAGEKMPWLTMHIALPLVFLTAYSVARLVPPLIARLRAREAPRWQWAGGAAVAAFAALAVLSTLYTDYGLNVAHPDTPVEPLIYVQTTPAVPRAAADIHAAVGRGVAHVLIDDTQGQGITWPWAWYLRHEPLAYAAPGDLAGGKFELNTIVITQAGNVPPDSPVLRQFAPPVTYHHRWWFPEEGYRAATTGSILRGMANGSLEAKWLQFEIRHIDPRDVISLDGQILYPRADK